MNYMPDSFVNKINSVIEPRFSVHLLVQVKQFVINFLQIIKLKRK